MIGLMKMGHGVARYGFAQFAKEKNVETFTVNIQA